MGSPALLRRYFPAPDLALEGGGAVKISTVWPPSWMRSRARVGEAAGAALLVLSGARPRSETTVATTTASATRSPAVRTPSKRRPRRLLPMF